MKKKIFFFSVFLILFIYFFFFFLKENMKNYNMNEPTLIPFENQKVLTDYNLSLISVQGHQMNLLAKQNKVLLLFFFTPDDKCTIKNLETLESLYNDYKTKIDFLLITNLENQQKIQKLYNSRKFSFNYLFSLSPLPKPFDNFDNHFYVVTKNGRIPLDISDGCVNINSKIVRLFLEGIVKKD